VNSSSGKKGKNIDKGKGMEKRAEKKTGGDKSVCKRFLKVKKKTYVAEDVQ